MTEPYSEDDLEWARKIMAQYQAAATETMLALVASCRQNKPEVAASVAHTLTEKGDEHLLMMVLGQMTTQIVKAQRQAKESHGPMLTPQEIGVDPEALKPSTWQVGMGDQLDAAVQDGDYRLWAKMAVDGQIQALLEDQAAGMEPDLDRILTGMLLLEQQSVVTIAAEMLRRLVIHAQERG